MPHRWLSDGIRRARPLVGAFVALCACAVVIGVVVLLVQTYSLTDSIRQSQKTAQDTNEAILSCTDPKGECAKRGQEQTAEAVDNIGRLAVYAAACADLEGVQGAPEIEKCMRDLIAEDEAKATRSGR